MKKNKKRLIMGLGTIGAIITPVATLISCGTAQKPKPAPKPRAGIEVVYKFLAANSANIKIDLGVVSDVTSFDELTNGLTLTQFKTLASKNFVASYQTAIDAVIKAKIAESQVASDKARLASIQNTIDYLIKNGTVTVDSFVFDAGTPPASTNNLYIRN